MERPRRRLKTKFSSLSYHSAAKNAKRLNSSLHRSVILLKFDSQALLFNLHPTQPTNNIYNREIWLVKSPIQVHEVCYVCSFPSFIHPTQLTHYVHLRMKKSRNLIPIASVHNIRLLNWPVVRMYHLSTPTNGQKNVTIRYFCDAKMWSSIQRTRLIFKDKDLKEI